MYGGVPGRARRVLSENFNCEYSGSLRRDMSLKRLRSIRMSGHSARAEARTMYVRREGAMGRRISPASRARGKKKAEGGGKESLTIQHVDHYARRIRVARDAGVISAVGQSGLCHQ